MKNKEFSKLSWAIYFMFIFCLTLEKTLCATGTEPAGKMKPRNKERTKSLSKLHIPSPKEDTRSQTWPFLYWDKFPLFRPKVLVLKDNVKFTDFENFIDNNYQPGEILQGNTFNQLKALNELYRKYKNKVGKSSKMSVKSLTEFIASLNIDIAEEPYNTVTFAQELMEDFSSQLQEYCKNDIRQHFQIIAVCTDIPTWGIEYYINTSEFPAYDDCLMPRDVAAMRYRIFGQGLSKTVEGLIILDPFRFGNSVLHLTQNMHSFETYVQTNDITQFEAISLDTSLLYYVKRPSLTEHTYKVNLVDPLKKIVTYNSNRKVVAEVVIIIEKNPKVKIYVQHEKNVEFFINDMTFNQSRSSDGNELVITLNKPSLKNDVCQVCGKKNWEFHHDDEKCLADRCLTSEFMQHVERKLWPQSTRPWGEILIETLYHAKEVVNDSKFIAAFGRVQKMWLSKRIHKLKLSQQEETVNIDSPTQETPTMVTPVNPMPMAENENINPTETTSELSNAVPGAASKSRFKIKGTHLAAALIVCIPIIISVIVKTHRSRRL